MSAINEQTSKPGLRLLVVDDDHHLCCLLRKHLEPEGFVLSAVHTGGEGLCEGMKASHELTAALMRIGLLVPERGIAHNGIEKKMEGTTLYQ
jgi:ActR/RegA family two-component response regulator